MTFYIYENWVASDKAMIHHETCAFCNNGEGTGRGTLGEKNGRWWGPFATSDEAFKKAGTLNRKEVAYCRHCFKNR